MVEGRKMEKVTTERHWTINRKNGMHFVAPKSTFETLCLVVANSEIRWTKHTFQCFLEADFIAGL